MNYNGKITLPPLIWRIFSVWYRHVRVYSQNLISNGFPPFVEPLIFLAGIGLGLGKYISTMEGIPYLQFLAVGLIVTSAMYTSAFECSFGTFIRLEFHKIYDSMLSAPITANNLLIGEIIWAGTKGLFFSTAVSSVFLLFKLVYLPYILIAPLVGFLTGIMMATLSLTITSFVNNINHFNFYFTGIISPMFFFSGVIFPLNSLPKIVRIIAEFLPLTHSIRLMRTIASGQFKAHIFFDLLYIILFSALFGYIGISKLKKKLIT